MQNIALLLQAPQQRLKQAPSLELKKLTIKALHRPLLLTLPLLNSPRMMRL